MRGHALVYPFGRIRANWRIRDMPVVIPEPDGEREGVPLWLCPNCQKYKPLQEYAWKKRTDICPGQQVWFKQGYCNLCLQALISASDPSVL